MAFVNPVLWYVNGNLAWKSSVEFSSETCRSVFRGMSLDDLGALASEVHLDVLATASSKQAPGWVAGGKAFRVSLYAA